MKLVASAAGTGELTKVEQRGATAPIRKSVHQNLREQRTKHDSTEVNNNNNTLTHIKLRSCDAR